MLNLFGFLLVVQLCLTAGTTVDWTVRSSLWGSNVGNRPFLWTSPRFDPLDPKPEECRAWPRDFNSDPLGDVATDVNPCSAEPPGKAASEAQFQIIAETGIPARHAPGSVPQTEPAGVGDSVLGRRHEFILILNDDPTVIESAVYLFERYASHSTLLCYQKGALHLLGGHMSVTGNYNVMLVAHGGRERGSARLAGYFSEVLERFASTLKSQGILGNLGTVTLLSCNLGNEPDFMLRPLKVLRSFGVKAKLRLYDAFLSVSPEGEIMTSSDGSLWFPHDVRRTIIAELGPSGEVLTKAELGCAGPLTSDYKGHVLYSQMYDWPSHPKMFVPMELRKKYPSIDCLEGLTWSLFFEECERRRSPDYVTNNQSQKIAVWLESERVEEHISFKQISNIQDLLTEIRFNAREEVSYDLYYVLNDCIYKVHRKSLNVTMAGKFINAENTAEIEYFYQSFKEQQYESSLQKLREGLKPSKFNDFCKQTFQYQQCSYNCERWGHYFMAAVFSASVRNFRTFSLFLMSVVGCEVGRMRGTDTGICSAFVEDDHPMMTDEPWPEHLGRGFYGCAVDNYEMAPESVQMWLEHVVAKENSLYVKSNQIMSIVSHDEQTELDIFGKVKVMNKYVFSSYLEYFRGTPEGKKLKIGCTQMSFESSKTV